MIHDYSAFDQVWACSERERSGNRMCLHDYYFQSTVIGGKHSKGREWRDGRCYIDPCDAYKTMGGRVVRLHQHGSATGKGVTQDLLRAANPGALKSIARACTSARPKRFCSRQDVRLASKGRRREDHRLIEYCIGQVW